MSDGPLFKILYYLSFGKQMEITEPKYLREVLATQARAIYEKINFDMRCQGLCIFFFPARRAGRRKLLPPIYLCVSTHCAPAHKKELQAILCKFTIFIYFFNP